MSVGVDLVKTMKAISVATGTQSEVLYGTVTSASPMRIRLEDSRELPDKLLVLSRFCREKWTDYETEHVHQYFDANDGLGASGSSTRITSPTTHRHLMWRGLIPGDKVIMISLNKGQKYYVIERVGDW